jgi:cytochrome c oxidase assembly protein subunit 15
MDGQWIPSGLLTMVPGWRNVFENAMTVQFDHRVLAYLLFLVALMNAWRSLTMPSIVLASAVFAQACLGIVTLLLHVPLGVALVHQAGALIVLAAAVWNLHVRLVTRSPDPNQR